MTSLIRPACHKLSVRRERPWHSRGSARSAAAVAGGWLAGQSLGSSVGRSNIAAAHLGAGGVGRPLAARLLADGERVLDVPAKLSARVRVFDIGQGRKTDATDAHAVVMAALRDRDQLRELSITEDLVVLRLLADRRDELSRSRAQGLNRLHRLMAELIPGGVPVKKSVPQYQTMLAGVRPRELVGRTVRRLAADQLADLVRLDARLKALKPS